MKTLVVGASTNTERYSFKAAKMLLANGHEVELLGKRVGEIDGKIINTTSHFDFENIDTITMYVGPNHQPDLYDYLLGLKPRRIIFNPGTENEVFEKRAENEGIIVEEACTLVLLSTKQY
ncbi:CoA-binding protein [Arcicella rosea]|uniref:Putative CoA-binding protein n=1 Tax=Arcicella rosea TaxID=502909 RepID=A0A841ENP3_9BACT|nr:CoA-binding protein [Arcicella rosea]MBB6003009.1 putative CoA-binding protein [Arcicella rosea]